MSMTTLSIDPGLRGCGCAFFSGGVLTAATWVENPVKAGRGPLAWMKMGSAVRHWAYLVARRDTISEVVLEMPRVYPGPAKVDLNDLLDLAGVNGAVVSAIQVPAVTHYFPSDWKGQQPKPVTLKNIRAALREGESNVIVTVGAKDHNTYDAIGIGLYHHRRYGRRRSLS